MAMDRVWLLTFAITSAVLVAHTRTSSHSGPVSTTTDITELCPYSDFCSHNASRRIDDPDLHPCCLPCSCSPNCASINNCCSDVTNTAMPTQVYPCRDQPQIYSEYLNIHNRHYIVSNSYRIVDGCPEEAMSDQSLSENVARCLNASEIEDLVFVSGHISGLTYLNRHCAICNKDLDYVPWTLYLVENLISTGESFEERDRNILTHGGVVSVPPSPRIAMPAICRDIEYNRCNQSNMWDFYDEEIDRKCTSTTSKQSLFVDFDGFFHRLITYANVYCYICNHPRGTVVPSVCSGVNINPLDTQGGWTAPFSAMIVLRPPPADQVPDCARGEWFDHFRRICTTLRCPDGSSEWDEGCTRLIDDMAGYQLVAYIGISVEHENATISSINIFNSMSNFVLAQFDYRCGMCYIELNNWTADSLCMRANLMTSTNCSVDYLLQGFAKLFPTPSVTVHLEGEMTRLFLNVTNITPKPFNRIIEENNAMFCEESNVFLVNETITCPSIELGPDEMRSFDDHFHAARMIATKSLHVGDGTLRICTEEYVSILKTTGLIAGTNGLNCPALLLVLLSILSSFYSSW